MNLLHVFSEMEYALKVRLSVFDRRKEREISKWSEWTSCDGQCGTGRGCKSGSQSRSQNLRLRTGSIFKKILIETGIFLYI